MKLFHVLFAILFSCGAFGQQEDLAPMRIIVMNKSRSALANEKITFTSRRTGKAYSGTTDARGQFMIRLPANDTYGIVIAVFGVELDHSTFDIPRRPPGATFNTVTMEIVYDPPASVVLENLHFEVAKAEIQPGSFAMLDELADYLKRKPLVRIRIEGHTDNQGSDAQNQLLSERRAKAVMNYLIGKGISQSRMTAVGKGEAVPIADNATEEGRAKNRRTEVHLQE